MKQKVFKGIVLCVAIVLVVGFCCFLNSETYLEWKVDSIIKEMHQYVKNDISPIQEMAEHIVNAQNQNDTLLWYGQNQGNFPNELFQQWQIFNEDCPIGFDEISINDSLLYPKGACVFSRTIWQGENIYAWISLVYCPDLTEEEQDWYKGCRQGSVQVNKEWFLVVVYGY